MNRLELGCLLLSWLCASLFSWEWRLHLVGPRCPFKSASGLHSSLSFKPVALLFVAIFALYINRFQIEPEEQVLSSLFGAEYIAYKARVRQWL